MAKKNSEKKVRFKYIFNKDYNPKYCNGAYGGLTIRGEIVMNFFQERMPLPNEQSHLITAENTLGDLVSSDPSDLRNTIVRVVDSGVIFNLQTAREFRDWLDLRISELEVRKSEIKKSNVTNTK